MKNQEFSSGVVMSTVFLMIALAMMVLGILIGIESFIQPSMESVDGHAVRPILLSNVQPEPIERRMYALMCLLLPLFSLAILWRNLKARQPLRMASIFNNKNIFFTVVLAASFGSLSFLNDRPYIKAILGMYPIYVERDRSLQVGTVIFVVTSLAAISFWPWVRAAISNFRLHIVLFLSLTTILPWRYFTEESIVRSGPWWGHADPIFYVLAQALHGKTLLVDVVSQYGLYPEFFFVFTKIFGASIEGISVAFILLQIVSIFCSMSVIDKVIKNGALFFLVCLSILATTGNMPIYFAGGTDMYLQYWPLRFFFPAISIYFFCKYIETKRPVWMVSVGVAAAVAPFWNLDTGIVVLGAWIFYNLNMLVVKWGALRSWRGNLVNLIFLAVSFLVVFLIFTAYVFWKSSGAFPNYEYLFYYQKIFYRDGFFMLPMPLKPSFWMLMLLVYFISICVAQYFLLLKSVDPLLLKTSEFVLYIATIGLGLFSYFQGRSHELVLATVSYPFFILVGVCFDSLITVRSPTRRYLLCALIFPGVLMMGCAAASFAFRVDRIYEGEWEWRKKGDAALAADLDFVKKSTKAHGNCLILTPMQGYFHLAAGVASPYNGPGLVEMILHRDELALYEFVKSKKAECIIFGFNAQDPALNIKYTDILEEYSVKNLNITNTLVYMVPRVVNSTFVR
jgi:hypothetical protein